MANEEQLVAFDNVGETTLVPCELETLIVGRCGDESPSFCLVIEDGGNTKKEEGINEIPKAPAADDFEFRTIGGGGGHLLKTEEPTDMCAADEVFFKGQILPLQPNSDISCLILPANWGPISRSGSQAEPMDRCPSTATSTGFTSRSGSSSSSSSGSGISRSHSSSSHSSVGGDAAPRVSLSNNFYAHPSPTPQVWHTKKASTTAARKSTGSMPPGWGLIRLGVVKAPEMELFDPRPQRVTSGIIGGAPPINRRSRSRSSYHNHQESKPVKKASDDKSCVAANCSKSSDGNHGSKQKRAIRILGMGMGCKGSPDGVVVDASAAASSGMLMRRRKKEGVRGGENRINV